MKFRLVSDPAWLLTSYDRDIPACVAPPPAHCACHLPRLGRGGWRWCYGVKSCSAKCPFPASMSRFSSSRY